jgi:hypothetical protein
MDENASVAEQIAAYSPSVLAYMQYGGGSALEESFTEQFGHLTT